MRLHEFQTLIGPNASGKSTLLDGIRFLGDLVASGLEDAVSKRTNNFQDLVWKRPGTDPGFEPAAELTHTPPVPPGASTDHGVVQFA